MPEVYFLPTLPAYWMKASESQCGLGLGPSYIVGWQLSFEWDKPSHPPGPAGALGEGSLLSSPRGLGLSLDCARAPPCVMQRLFCWGARKREGRGAACREIRGPRVNFKCENEPEAGNTSPGLFRIFPLRLLTSEDALTTSVRFKGMQISAPGWGKWRGTHSEIHDRPLPSPRPLTATNTVNPA